MNRIIILILAFFSFFTLKVNANQTFSQKKVPVIHLKGDGYQRGLQHGSQLKKEIGEVFKKWKESVKKDTGKDADYVIQDFLKTSNYLTAIKQWTPDIYDEIRGIAEGSNQSLDDVLAFQMIDEYWGYLDRLEHNSVDKDHCSAIGVARTKNSPTFVSQNIDIDSYMDGYQVLLHIEKSKNTPEQFIMTCAGYLGFAGMNKNVALAINALTDLNNSVDGLPVPFVTRGILQQKSGKAAIDFVHQIKHATGQNYLIGTNKQVYTFEASANQVVEFRPKQNNQLVYHTNHSLENHDVKPWMEKYHQMILSGEKLKGNSITRMESLSNQIDRLSSLPTTTDAKQILRSKEDEKFPICVTLKEGAPAFTFSSVIFTLGKKPSAEVTYGSPDQSDYQIHYLNN